MSVRNLFVVAALVTAAVPAAFAADEPVAKVTLFPSYALLNLGESTVFIASASNATGGFVGNVTYTWSASGGSLAQVGNVTTFVRFVPDAIGVYEVFATSDDGVVGTATVEVVDVRSVVVTPSAKTVNHGQKISFTAVAYDGDGDVVDVPIGWSAARGGINARGNYTATRAGADTVTASFHGVNGTASVNVVTTMPSTLVMGASTYAVGDGLDTIGGTFRTAFLDGTVPARTGTLVSLEQLAPTGQVVRGTFFNGVVGADGSYTFTVPTGWNLPGSYRLSVRATDGTNVGTAQATYDVTL